VHDMQTKSESTAFELCHLQNILLCILNRSCCHYTTLSLHRE
jgi:hypothetical protein